MTLLDPSDIEKVTILKNGSAVWGAKGANGVVLIDTKRAREMATQIEANISMGFQTPFGSLPLMGAAPIGVMRQILCPVWTAMKLKVSSLPMTTRPVRFTVRYTTIRNGRIKSTRRHLSKTMAFRLPVGMILRFIVSPWDMPKNDGNIDGTSFNRLNVRFNSDIKLTEDFKIQTDISYAQTGAGLFLKGWTACVHLISYHW